MAGFRTHITTSSLLGVGYAGVGVYRGLPIESALIAGAMCGVGGMLPDIDSDSGVPLREVMSFFAAVAPVFLAERFASMGLNPEQLVLIGVSTYLFVRFGIAKLLMRFTIHRGMFHSIPGLILFTEIAFLIAGNIDLSLRYFKAGGVFVGALSHLVLDEIYSVEWTGGRWRFKSSFGTALKFWGPTLRGNVSVYGKLAVVTLLVLSEPAVMERYGQLSPIVINRERVEDRLNTRLNEGLERIAARATADGRGLPPAITRAGLEGSPVLGPDAQPTGASPQRDRTIYDTARRLWRRLHE